MIKDPVCGMDVLPEKAAAKLTYNKQDYYFCNSNCYEKFKSNPEFYLSSKSGEPIKKTAAGSKNISKLNIPISGMSCASCALTIENSLNNIKGVFHVNVNFAKETASVIFDPAISIDKLKKSIENAGYGIKEQTVTVKIGGMSCGSCAMTIEDTLKKKKGIMKVSVNFMTKKAFITYMPGIINEFEIIKTIESTGYSVIDKDDETDPALIEAAETKERFIHAWVISIPVIILMVLHMFFKVQIPYYYIIEVILSAVVLLIPGYKTIKSGILSLLHRSANMDVLIMLGTFASLFTGILKLIGLQIESFAGVGAMIMAIHLTGRYIEASAKGRASAAIKQLLNLGAKTAKILKNGVEKKIPIELIKVGDIMVVRPGEKIPTDGIIISGEAEIDESMVTGESMPVKRKEQDEVIGGTINMHGFLKVKAIKIGNDTFLSQVIKLVEECQGTKVPIQEFADKVTSVFVPIVIGISVLTFLLWYIFPITAYTFVNWVAQYIPWISPNLPMLSLALFASIAVLVIACPCALGLATPTALMMSSARGAKLGILFRSGEAIQTLKEVKTIVLDKTGTITKGKPEVTDIISCDNLTEDKLLQLTASLEQGSEHPLAQSILDKAKKKKLSLFDPHNFSTLPGMGITGEVNNKHILIGNQAYLAEKNIAIPEEIEKQISQLEGVGKTVALVAVENRLSGFIAIADTIKDGSGEAILLLKQMGLDIVMLTGDNKKTARAIADKVGIDQVVANVLPGKKLEIIKNLQKNRIVAMVGDGINDAPALTQANVGIAIGTGTDIAIESSDVTIVNGFLISIVQAIKLSRATFKKIKENLFWAFFYNIIAIPLAMLGVLHPIIAEAAMGFSSVNVVTNSMRLKKIKL